MDVEGSGHGTDRLSVSDEFPSEFLLVWAHFPWPAVAIIDAWRAALKRRDIFARPGTRYGDPRRGLLDGATWQSSKLVLVVCRALNRSLDAATEITGLSRLLDSAYRTVADRAASNADLRFETVNGKTRIVVTPLDRLEETESLRALRPAIQGRMPKAGMPDLFLKSCSAPALPKPSPISASGRPGSSISKPACARR